MVAEQEECFAMSDKKRLPNHANRLLTSLLSRVEISGRALGSSWGSSTSAAPLHESSVYRDVGEVITPGATNRCIKRISFHRKNVLPSFSSKQTERLTGSVYSSVSKLFNNKTRAPSLCYAIYSYRAFASVTAMNLQRVMSSPEAPGCVTLVVKTSMPSRLYVISGRISRSGRR